MKRCEFSSPLSDRCRRLRRRNDSHLLNETNPIPFAYRSQGTPESRHSTEVAATGQKRLDLFPRHWSLYERFELKPCSLDRLHLLCSHLDNLACTRETGDPFRERRSEFVVDDAKVPYVEQRLPLYLCRTTGRHKPAAGSKSQPLSPAPGTLAVNRAAPTVRPIVLQELSEIGRVGALIDRAPAYDAVVHLGRRAWAGGLALTNAPAQRHPRHPSSDGHNDSPSLRGVR